MSEEAQINVLDGELTESKMIGKQLLWWKNKPAEEYAHGKKIFRRRNAPVGE